MYLSVNPGVNASLNFSAQFPFDSENGSSYPVAGSPELDVSIGTSGCAFGLQWQSGAPSPTFSVTDNANCQVSLASSWNNPSYGQGYLSFGVTVTFPSSLGGQSLPYYLQAVDNLGGTSSGWWQDPGAYVSVIAQPVSNGPPQLGTLTPMNSATPPNQGINLSFTATDPNGWGNANELDLLISADHNPVNACLIVYNTMYGGPAFLFSDDLSTWLWASWSTPASNSHCSLSISSRINAYPGVPNLTGTYQVTFTPAAVGVNSVDQYISDPTWGTSAGWGQIGSVTVSSNPIITTMCSDLPVGIVGANYGNSLNVAGSNPPFTWSVTSGSLPPGLVLYSNSTMYTASFGYAPTQTGTYSFSISVRDALGRNTNTPLNCSINVVTQSQTVTQNASRIPDPPMLGTKVGVFRNHSAVLEDSNGNGEYDQWFDRYISSFTGPGGFVSGDIPVVGDWNGDGKAKCGIYRASTGQWFLDSNDSGVFDAGDLTYGFGGIAGDTPVVGDWNGVQGLSAHKDCIGVFRQGFFWVLDLNCNGSFDGTGPGQDTYFPFGGQVDQQGNPVDIPVVGKWTGGKTRVGLVRKYAPAGVPQGNPFFWVLDNADPDAGTAASNHQPGYTFAFGGLAGDVFVAGDWSDNSDGTYGTGGNPFTAGVYRNGMWVLDPCLPGAPQDCHSGTTRHLLVTPYGGVAGDIPITGKWAKAQPLVVQTPISPLSVTQWGPASLLPVHVAPGFTIASATSNELTGRATDWRAAFPDALPNPLAPGITNLRIVAADTYIVSRNPLNRQPVPPSNNYTFSFNLTCAPPSQPPPNFANYAPCSNATTITIPLSVTGPAEQGHFTLHTTFSQLGLDDYRTPLNTGGLTIDGCDPGWTMQQCFRYAFQNDSSTPWYRLGVTGYIAQGVTGVRWYFPASYSVPGLHSHAWDISNAGNPAVCTTPGTSQGCGSLGSGNPADPVDTYWSNFKSFLQDLRSYGIRYVSPYCSGSVGNGEGVPPVS
jgi:hypothetical protein